MPRVERLRVYPVKGLDGIDVDDARIREGGTLQYDRTYALFDSNGDVINGKRTDRVHDVTTEFDPHTGAIEVCTVGRDRREFDLDAESGAAERWFSDVFETEVSLRRDDSVGFVDRRSMGPSLVSSATLETVASWFDRMTVSGARRRLRANVEISGVPAFWEDRFVGANAPALELDGVRVEGVTPCGRCVVPERDPDTGEPTPGFRDTFREKRTETFPAWADRDAFDHYYSMMILTRVPEPARGGTVAVGDPVEVLE